MEGTQWPCFSSNGQPITTHMVYPPQFPFPNFYQFSPQGYFDPGKFNTLQTQRPGRGRTVYTNQSQTQTLNNSKKTKTSPGQQYCTHCQKRFHTEETRFKLHPELQEAFATKRAKRNQEQDQTKPFSPSLATLNEQELAVVEGKIGRFTAMLVVGATITLGANLYMCQDTGASLNAIEKRQQRKQNVLLFY